jgi:hypothetical protein
LEKGLSIAENILKWGVGGINIDATRIGYREDDHVLKYEGYSNGQYKSEYEDGTSYKHGNQVQINTQGRFPANIIFTHHPECECIGTKKIKAIKGGIGEKSMGGMGKNGIYGKYSNDKLGANAGGLGDADGNEEVENWDCHEDCPIRILDEQSGVSKSPIKVSSGGKTFHGEKYDSRGIDKNCFGDKGGASRFFYVAKASKAERNKGLEGFEEKRMEGRDEGQDERSVAFKARPTPMANVHPTVKPVKLMQYLVKMITPPNGIVLDPFCGSGTTGVACKLEGFQFVGMEQDPEYIKIAESRINNYVEENGKAKKMKPKENEEPITTQTTLF